MTNVNKPKTFQLTVHPEIQKEMERRKFTCIALNESTEKNQSYSLWQPEEGGKLPPMGIECVGNRYTLLLPVQQGNYNTLVSDLEDGFKIIDELEVEPIKIAA